MIQAVRNAIDRGKMPHVVTTPQSVSYRRLAAKLAREAEREPDFEKMMKLMDQALTWIDLAENEEILLQATGDTGE